MKLKILVLFILIISFLGSYKPYKIVLEEEKQNELIKNSIQADYKIENIYKINRKSVLELNLQEGKKYKFQYFSKRYFDMILLDSQTEIRAKNKISYGDSSYFTKTIIFECKNTGIYNLKLEGKHFPNSSLLAVASQNIENQIDDKEEYTFAKKYHVAHKWYRSYSENPQYTCVFYKGVTYKYTFEKGIAALLFYNSRRELIMEYTPSTNEKEFEFKNKSTGIYYLTIINPINHKDSVAVINAYHNRPDSTDLK
ncbi:hypothetical protein Fleli_2948 [Bernardetia litoralis DSM 6794]|uniref:Uncharacterized protein n=1 Tax=Bernardetia litoralis (strain ATCC 23117 / DSM 6794 / NBRC 15988 / NCIMB 1366 / Fx l1 / Sio-4) TaxID=880071 RepID=I4AMW0_BERLS|nr:hypothetical protein [Bernardetia litoralis]AFM05295.1 hypothetical protein Fleli_2948 [Bernardetia litoralis DSM 6794]